MAQRFLQPTLSGGELSPGLAGRVDLVRYATSVKQCRNFIIKPTGGAFKRPGTRFRGEVKDSTKFVRIIPFIYSTTARYLIEMGPAYMRFWVNGALLRDGSNNIVEVVTPYTEAQVPAVRFTQSADVLYLAHPQVRPQELRRTAVDAFEIRPFDFKRGPFRGFNSDEAAIMAVSATQGVVTITTNVDTFTSQMVGSLVYVEEKELRSVKPWVPGERGIAAGQLRRSDSKVYRCVSTSLSTGTGTPYVITGSVRPTHETGRAWDGPGDKKNDGVNDYYTGAEWEYVHGGFGILQVTAVANAKTATATVIERVPDSIIGTAPSPGNTWTLNGDAATKTFTISGATSTSHLDYSVTINGVPVQSNPAYTGGGGVGGGGGGGINRPGLNPGDSDYR